MNQNDPKNPSSQQPQSQQPQQAPAPQGAGFHFLAGMGELAIAAAHFFGGRSDDDEAEEPEAPSRRRFRPRVFGAGASGRVGAKPCCKRPVGK